MEEIEISGMVFDNCAIFCHCIILYSVFLELINLDSCLTQECLEVRFWKFLEMHPRD